MRFIRYLLDKLIYLFIGRYVIPERRKMDIDLSDLLNESTDPAGDDTLLTDKFKSFSSTADYNREFLNVFHLHRKDIILDLNHKDGHFRV